MNLRVILDLLLVWRPNGQIEKKSCPLADLTFYNDITTVLLDNLMGDGETQPAPVFFSSEERIKDIFQIPFRNSRTGISDRNLDILLGAVLGEEPGGHLNHSSTFN